MKLELKIETEGKVLEELDRELDDIVDEIFTKSQENIIINGTWDEGTLSQSGNVQREFLVKKITYAAPHAAPVEYGSEPHMPPVAPLIGWAKRQAMRKGRTKRVKIKPRTTKGYVKLADDEATKLAWAIAMKIKKEGTDAKPFLRPAISVVVKKRGL